MSQRKETGTVTKEWEDVLVAEDEQFPFSPYCGNDDVNTFDWVTQSLMKFAIVGLSRRSNAPLFIHYNGKYAVKQGEYTKLRPMCEAALDGGISATIRRSSGRLK